jgi:hypothetical protein
MYLNATNLNLQAVLAGAVTTNQLECHVCYTIYNAKGTDSKPSMYRSATNNTTDVNILPAPTVQGTVFVVEYLSIYNKDTVSATVTVKTDDGTTERIVVKQQLLTTETLNWTPTSGWFII